MIIYCDKVFNKVEKQALIIFTPRSPFTLINKNCNSDKVLYFLQLHEQDKD